MVSAELIANLHLEVPTTPGENSKRLQQLKTLSRKPEERPRPDSLLPWQQEGLEASVLDPLIWGAATTPPPERSPQTPGSLQLPCLKGGSGERRQCGPSPDSGLKVSVRPQRRIRPQSVVASECCQGSAGSPNPFVFLHGAQHNALHTRGV